MALAKQADFRFEVAVPLTSFDKKTIQEFLKFLKDAEVLLPLLYDSPI